MSVAAETLGSGGRVYRVVVKMRESAGVAANISSIDLTFMSGSSMVASFHTDRPISDSANTCPANGTVDSRELMTRDDDSSHPHATSVTAKVTFAATGSTSTPKNITASADVPSSVPSVEAFTLAGVVSDDRTGRAVVGGTVQVVDGPNAGKRSATDGNGYYSMAGVAVGSFTARAAADGYNQSDQGITVSKDTRLDFKLRPLQAPPPPPPPPPSSCAYSISPTSVSYSWRGGSFTVTITNTSGSCSWQAASNVGWITFPGSTSGNGSATLTYIVVANGGVVASNTRFATITISWAGGSAQLSVQQGGANPELCLFSVTNGPQDFSNVPSSGGQLTATVTFIDTGHPACSVTVFNDAPWISALPFIRPPGGTLTLTVAPNPSPGTARSASVILRSTSGSTATLVVTQR